MRALLCALLSLGLPAMVGAQSLVEPRGIELPIGSSLGGGDDVVLNVALPFAFPLPDGTTTNSLDVSTNGIIYPGGVGVVDPTESEVEFTSRVAIAPFWHDLKDFDGNASQVYFSTRTPVLTPTVAIFTWLDVTIAGGLQPFTMQAILFDSGQVSFRYDDRFARVNVDGGLIGISDGSGSATAVDYSTIDPVVPTPTSRSAIEAFARPAIADFGRADEFTNIRFFPDNPFTGYSLFGDVAPIAGVVAGRRACSCQELGFTIMPSGSGFALQQGADFDSDFEAGTPYVVDRGDNIPITTPFPVPVGGQSISNWYIGSTGLLSTDSSPVAPFESPATLGTHAVIAPALADWRSFSAPNVWVHEIDQDTFSVTWRGFRQWSSSSPAIDTDPPASTFQAIVSSTGDIWFAYEQLDFTVSGPQAFLVGVSDGVTPAVTETDFSVSPASTTAPLIYEYFDSFSLEQIDFPRHVNDGRTVELISPPRIGHPLSAVAFDPAGPQTLDLFLLGFPGGFSSPLVPLGFVDPALTACNILVETVTSVPIAVGAAPNPGGTLIVDVPNIAVLIGFELSLQAFLVNSSVMPGLMPTDEILLRFGI